MLSLHDHTPRVRSAIRRFYRDVRRRGFPPGDAHVLVSAMIDAADRDAPGARSAFGRFVIFLDPE